MAMSGQNGKDAAKEPSVSTAVASSGAPRVRCAVCGHAKARASDTCERCQDTVSLEWLAKSRAAGRRSFLVEAATGFLTFFRALRFLAKHRRLWPFAVGPTAVNILLVVGLFAAVFWFVPGWAAGWVEEGWLSILLVGLAVTVAVFVAAVVSFFLFVAVGNVVAAPFNDFLSEKAEAIAVGGKFDEPFSVPQFVTDVVRSVLEALKLLLVKVVVLLPLLFLNLIPFVGAVPFILAMMYFAALDYMDLPMERKRYRLWEKRRVMRASRAKCLGFGAAAYLSLLIPFLGLFMLPVGVVGGTLLFLDAQEK